ncbi:hypothetical protein SHIRM173S_04406 [Streptomyces hirsutus]
MGGLGGGDVEGEPAAESVEGDGVAPQDPVDVVLGEAFGEHQVGDLAGLERVALAPVGGGVRQDPLGAVGAQDRDHPFLVHLGVGIDGEAEPAAAVLGLLDGGLVEMVDQDVLRGQRGLPYDVEGAAQSGELVAVRCVHQGGQAVVGGELELDGERGVLRGRHGVVADLADGHDVVLDEIPGQQVEDGRAARVVRLLGVEGDGAVVGDAVLGGAEGFPAEEGVEVVDEGGGRGAGLAEPEGGFDDGADARPVHGLVVVGGPRRHVDVGVEEAHQDSLPWGSSVV